MSASSQFYALAISEVRPETDSAICVSFDVPPHLRENFRFIQGQFLTLKVIIDGEEVRRSYSICSNACDQQLRVGIKRVRNGAFSNYANDNFETGDTIDVMPPQGNFFTPLNPANEKNYMCIAAGSGITPVLSQIATILDTEPCSRVTLIYGNRRSTSVMFKEELCFLKNRYMTRLQWINIMDEEDQGSDLFNGIIDNKKGFALANARLIDIASTDEAFICGPEAMMSEVSRGFRLEGLTESNIHFELFANSSADARAILQKTQQRIETYGEQ
ncbi:MAG: FAD-binding oxidoreductase, partial [Pseudomonadota bacterium]